MTYVAGTALLGATMATAWLATSLVPISLALAVASVLGCAATLTGAVRQSPLHRRSGRVLPEGVVIEESAPESQTYRAHAEPQPDEVRMLVRQTPHPFAAAILLHLGMAWLPLVCPSTISRDPWPVVPYVALAWLVLAAPCLAREHTLRIERRARTLHFDDAAVILPHGAVLRVRQRRKRGPVLECLDDDGEPVRLIELHPALTHPQTLVPLLREVFPDLVFADPTRPAVVSEAVREATRSAARRARQTWEVVSIELRKRDDRERPSGSDRPVR
ncbi:MAG: hypothetical protein K1X94_12445 [Sandaracinaceae bacterium]|nr:hypothetical protein [Sandaracinaceae bacterium]